MKRIFSTKTIVIILFICGFNVKGKAYFQHETYLQQEKSDGPYLIYTENKVKIINVKYAANIPKLKTEILEINDIRDKLIKVKPNSNMPAFSFKIFKYQAEPASFEKPEKLFVVSDIEGNLKDFTIILQAGGVIDKKYNWIYGKNHLVINGDLFDRGNDVTAFLWLCYKLDGESRQNGGYVHITLGNHDEMNLRGNTNYVQPKYLYVDSLIGIEHKQLYDENSEIGRWLRTKNSLTIIDSTLFVHGGISNELINLKLNPGQINQIIRENLGKGETLMEQIPKFLFGINGPFWYRGLVINHPKFKPVTPEQLNSILGYLGIKRMVVGHCIVPEIIGLHGGKVIAADVDHYENMKEKRSRALLITNNQFFTVNDLGEIKNLPFIDGFGTDIKSNMKD